MINLTDEERAVGRENYYSAVSTHDQMHRREFLVKSFAAGGVSAAEWERCTLVTAVPIVVYGFA